MFKFLLIASALVLGAQQAYSQVDSLNYGPEPIGGISRVALPFYKINFSGQQRALLQEKEVELIFSVDTVGLATLEDINGIDDAAIQDSLRQAATKVPRFYPRTIDGKKESALYFLQFQMPVYSEAQTVAQQRMSLLHTYKEHPYEAYDYIHKSGQRIDVQIGAVGNAFVGRPGKYLYPGGGMKLDVLYTGKKGIGAGMVMSMYGNKLRKHYPIASIREPNSAPPTILMGVGIHKLLQVKERNELHAQLELSYAAQNITPKLEHEDEDWTQLRGFSPGIVLNYLLKIGKDKTAFYYAQPSIMNHYLNLHGAVRPVFFNLREATGVMVEVGVSYRLTSHFVDEYRLKQ